MVKKKYTNLLYQQIKRLKKLLYTNTITDQAIGKKILLTMTVQKAKLILKVRKILLVPKTDTIITSVKNAEHIAVLTVFRKPKKKL